ncbi:type 1 glutamine amidotransferase [Alteromonas sp. BL110]|uniref:type 1 glutamine amidotransferase domain-containing protein n=1 Tax=Alteromonas sp. BL110 TaxID=1714845 RepID=UPI000E4EEE40|nr:type 1 glutamine amidotransferase domain-containing protein [Alteromonas sp. BL110]AXT39559.1 type 1 glutamine amidotransferase [Alteromonas sp. BL110]RKM81955.1 DJ-1/PfpI/YhbO family deglycase/protease [Alteromonas sp. BL110]
MSNSQNLQGKKIAILATNGFEQSELVQPKEMFTERGAHVDILSIEDQTSIKAWDEDDWGKDVDVDLQVSSANLNNYDALVLPGGQINPDVLRANKDAVNFIKEANSTDSIKAVGAICHGPWLLVESGLAKGATLTSFPSIQTDLKNAGANWVDKEVVTDDKLVTSRNPNDIPAFVDQISKMIA